MCVNYTCIVIVHVHVHYVCEYHCQSLICLHLSQEQLSLARQRRDLQEHQLISARDSPLETDNDDIDAGHSPWTSPVAPPTSDSMALPPTADSNHTHDTTTTNTLPPISQHRASLTSLDLHPLLSSSAPVQIANHGRPHRRGGGLGTKLHTSGAHHLNYSSTSRRYSPASSPAHSQQLPLMTSMLGSGRQSVQSELKQIEYIRNLRQLALLAEQVRMTQWKRRGRERKRERGEGGRESERVQQCCVRMLAGGQVCWFIGVVVITSALHAESPGFDPQMNQV